MSITIKDKANADKVFTKVSQSGDRADFSCAGSNLQDSMSLALTLKSNGKTNRVIGKLTVPTTHTSPSTGLVEIAYTEVGSFDLTAVRFASTDAAENFYALLSSLIANAGIKDMYLTGTMPS